MSNFQPASGSEKDDLMRRFGQMMDTVRFNPPRDRHAELTEEQKADVEKGLKARRGETP